MPSAWPRAPQQTFHLKVPKPPTGAAPRPASRPAAPPRRQAPPSSSILTGSALPVGYTAPRAPEVEPFEPQPEVTPAPPFIAPPETPFIAPRRARRAENRMPIFIAAAVAVAAGMAGVAWLMLREPEPTTTFEPVAAAPYVAPAAREPVIVPPALIGIAPEPVDEPAETVSRPAASTRSAVELPSGPQAYSGDAAPAAPSVVAPPLVIPPVPAPPPASAPAPQTPVADPDAPHSTRDPSTGD